MEPTQLTQKQWAIIYAALLEQPVGLIHDSLGGTEFSPVSEEEVEEVFQLARIGAGMVILAISGTTLDEMALGEHRFNYDEAGFSDQAVYANVCGGDSSSSFDYDQPARNGTIVIEEAPGGQRTVEVQTETPVLDPMTGLETGEVETSTSNFTFRPQG